MKSLQRRLGVGLALGVTFLWLIAALVSGLIISHELGEAADSALRVTAQQLLAITSETTTNGSSAVGETRDAELAPELMPPAGVDRFEEQWHEWAEISSLLGFMIRNRDGELLFSGGSLPDSLRQARLMDGFGMIEGHRVYGESTADQQRWVLIAEPIHHRNEIKRGALRVLLSILPLLIPLSLLLVWWIVRRSMRSVRQVQLQIESRGGDDLAPLQTSDMPTELVPIAESVNHLLSRLARTLESERNFASNSAHELRTPIASALAQTQRQIVSLPEGSERERAQRIEQTLHELSRTSEKLMQLARAESGSMVGAVPGNVYPVIDHLMREFNSVHSEESRLQLRCLHQARFMSLLDIDGAAILLRNLMDNALKYSKPGTQVQIMVDSDANRISIINEGPVIAAEELALLKQRFRRGEGSQVSGTAGAGLGLAIAETIARQAGISIELYSPARGREDGFEARLTAAP